MCHAWATCVALTFALRSPIICAQTAASSAQPAVAAPSNVPPDKTSPASTAPAGWGPADGAHTTFGVDFGASYQNEPGSTSYVLAPLLEGALPLNRRMLLDLTWGAAWMVDSEGLGESTGRLGNPMASLILRGQEGGWRFRASLGVTAPLAHFPLSLDGRLYEFVYNQTQAMWGMWNQWLWVPDRMAVPASGWLGYALPTGQKLVAEAAVAPVFGVRGTATGTSLVGQIAMEAILPIEGAVAVRPRLQSVVLPSSSFDRLQTAAGLRISYHTGYGSFFVGVLINLDKPLGVLYGQQRWALHIGKEVEL